MMIKTMTEVANEMVDMQIWSIGSRSVMSRRGTDSFDPKLKAKSLVETTLIILLRPISVAESIEYSDLIISSSLRETSRSSRGLPMPWYEEAEAT